MTPQRLTDDMHRLLAAPNYGHLATLMPDGAPKVDPVWVHHDNDRVLIATDAHTIKARNITADPRVALSVVAFDDPYDQLLIRGRVVATTPDDDLQILDLMSAKYLGAPFPRRRWANRVTFHIAADTARHYRSPLRDPRTPTGDRH